MFAIPQGRNLFRKRTCLSMLLVIDICKLMFLRKGLTALFSLISMHGKFFLQLHKYLGTSPCLTTLRYIPSLEKNTTSLFNLSFLNPTLWCFCYYDFGKSTDMVKLEGLGWCEVWKVFPFPSSLLPPILWLISSPCWWFYLLGWTDFHLCIWLLMTWEPCPKVFWLFW